MTGGKQVGEEVVGEGIHRIGQFQVLVAAALTGDNSLLQGHGMTGLVGQQGPFAKMVPVAGGQFQVAPQGKQGGGKAAAAGDLVPFAREGIAQFVVGFVRLPAIPDRLVGRGDFALHDLQDLLCLFSRGGQYRQ